MKSVLAHNLFKEEMNKVTATEESDVAVSDVPQTQMKYMSQNKTSALQYIAT